MLVGGGSPNKSIGGGRGPPNKSIVSIVYRGGRGFPPNKSGKGKGEREKGKGKREKGKGKRAIVYPH